MIAPLADSDADDIAMPLAPIPGAYEVEASGFLPDERGDRDAAWGFWESLFASSSVLWRVVGTF